MKPIYKRPWFIAIAIIFGVAFIQAVITDNDTKSDDNSSAVAEADIKPSSEKQTAPPTEKPTEEKIEPTTEKLTEKLPEAETEENDENDSEDEDDFIDGIKDKASGALSYIKGKAKGVLGLVDEKTELNLSDVKDIADEIFGNNEDDEEFVYDGKEEMMGFGIQYKDNLIFDGETITIYLDDNSYFPHQNKEKSS